jgi:hypothetical protein
MGSESEEKNNNIDQNFQSAKDKYDRGNVI